MDLRGCLINQRQVTWISPSLRAAAHSWTKLVKKLEEISEFNQMLPGLTLSFTNMQINANVLGCLTLEEISEFNHLVWTFWFFRCRFRPFLFWAYHWGRGSCFLFVVLFVLWIKFLVYKKTKKKSYTTEYK